MGVGTFPIGGITVGGGTGFNQIVAQLLSTLANTQAQRAQVGTDLFSTVLQAETAARRRPVNIVDQLMLAREFGSVLPLSQISGERLAGLGGRTNPRLQELFDAVTRFATREVPEGSPASPGFGDVRDAQLILQREAGLVDENFQPVEMQRGGSLVADPRRATSARTGARGVTAAAPVRMVDANQQTVAVAGEGGARERLNVEPLPVGLGGDGQARTQGEQRGGFDIGALAKLPRDVRFRLEALLEETEGLAQPTALGIAQRPGDFERFLGMESDPRAVAARLLGGGIQQDVRFQDPLVRSLALGRAPTSAQISAQEFSALPPDLMQSLIGIIGEDQLPGFLFALQAGTPTGATGVRRRAAGGVRV